MRSCGVRGATLGLNDRESVLSGVSFKRGLPRGCRSAVGGVGEFLEESIPRMESFRDDSEAGMKRNARDNPEGLVLLDEDGEPRDLGLVKGDSSDIPLLGCGGEPESEITTELERVRV